MGRAKAAPAEAAKNKSKMPGERVAMDADAEYGYGPELLDFGGGSLLFWKDELLMYALPVLLSLVLPLVLIWAALRGLDRKKALLSYFCGMMSLIAVRYGLAFGYFCRQDVLYLGGPMDWLFVAPYWIAAVVSGVLVCIGVGRLSLWLFEKGRSGAMCAIKWVR